jgi:uncharacterized membrane protein
VDRGRLEAFSDGVFAVAITLLALDLAVPGPGHGPLGEQLASRWPAYLAYVVSFLTIGIIWVNHHALVNNFARVDRVLLFLNLLLLFFIVTLPFATATIADYLRQPGPDAGLAAAIYEGVFLGMSLAFAGLFWWSARRAHLSTPMTAAQARAALARFAAGGPVYAVAIGIGWLSATAALVISGAVALYYLFERTPAPAPPKPGD